MPSASIEQQRERVAEAALRLLRVAVGASRSAAQSLARNHVFLDGNERVAFPTCAVFLDLNGMQLEVDADAAERFLIESVIKRHAELAEITSWLESVMRPISPRD